MGHISYGRIRKPEVYSTGSTLLHLNGDEAKKKKMIVELQILHPACTYIRARCWYTIYPRYDDDFHHERAKPSTSILPFRALFKAKCCRIV